MHSLHLEAGENRMVALPANDGARPPALVARFDGCFRRAQRWRGAGVAVPVFSLRRWVGVAAAGVQVCQAGKGAWALLGKQHMGAGEVIIGPDVHIFNSRPSLLPRLTLRNALFAPLHANHSAQSVGAGEFMDLMPLVDLCAATGFSLIQAGGGRCVGRAGPGQQTRPAACPAALPCRALAAPALPCRPLTTD